MTEDEARDWLLSRYSATQIAQLERFVALLEAAAQEQSLIASSTLPAIWARHIVDSAQLVALSPPTGNWLDIGSGGGLPGIVIAVLRDAPMTLSEPRGKRAEFLDIVTSNLGLTNVTVQPAKVQNLKSGHFDVVSARAVAPIGDIFTWSETVVSRETRFLLPRGQSWAEELEITKRAWHGQFHVEQSLTNTASSIVTADDVQKR